MYQRLFRDIEDEYNDEIESRIEQRERRSFKELDVKVAFEYPKGNFRFPLIPDDKKLHREERNVSSEKKQEPISSQNRVKEQQTDERPVKRVRPFTPTYIPSPIYGFAKTNEKVNKEEEVEYELNGFISVEDSTIDSIYIEQAKTPDHFQQDDSVESSMQQENEACSLEEALAVLRVSEVGGLEATKEHETDLKPALPEAVESLVKTEGHAILMEPSGEMEETEVSPYKGTTGLDELVEETAEDNQESAVEADSSAVHTASSALTETTASQSEASFDVDEATADKPALKETIPSPTTRSTKARSHLPFNVLMLKQDKRKLEQKAAERRQSPLPDARKELIKEGPSSSAPEVKPVIDNDYSFPGLSLLNPPVQAEGDPAWLAERKQMLDTTLFNFNVGAKVVNVTQGPSVTRFEIQPEPGVKVNKVTNLSDDIKLSLAARDIRIEAPIPGKHTIGIEVPNPKSRPVLISEIIGTPLFMESASPLTAVLGLDISGKPIVTDLKKMPHGLIAGATGSGKSVCINSILVSLLYKASPDDLKLLLIDPKMVELAPYNRIPHLVSPVITDVKAATAALKWAVEEMEKRYELFAHAGVRDINRFNELAMETKRYSDKLPFLVIIIDELADLMMMAPADVEEAICRIAQKARACGIHLIIATQRPSVDVITGLIKANVPTRIAFSVSSQVDSRTIIDISGAERLLGRGDMLFLENGSSKPVRLQGTFVSDAEIDKVVSFAREQRSPNYLFEQEELLKKAQVTEEEDELFYEACEFVIEQGGASTSSLQRRFKVGYNRAARLIDMMEVAGYISGARGSKPRDVLISETDLESIQAAGSVQY
ncbi:DNA translocase FtsK [Neobacillus notoginsengisoli]|uniref:DNA translocase FtsK n=1 Tax=Neobacillus notoginsengisoli TaxID=1578198 RepID=A0A417YUH9_9BACI|nr:DNA translocase FtsK [Neobacillus notoginsengisoli]